MAAVLVVGTVLAVGGEVLRDQHDLAGLELFDLGEDRILAVEVLPFGGESKLIFTGFHLTDAAIWVGTLEE